MERAVKRQTNATKQNVKANHPSTNGSDYYRCQRSLFNDMINSFYVCLPINSCSLPYRHVL